MYLPSLLLCHLTCQHDPVDLFDPFDCGLTDSALGIGASKLVRDPEPATLLSMFGFVALSDLQGVLDSVASISTRKTGPGKSHG